MIAFVAGLASGPLLGIDPSAAPAALAVPANTDDPTSNGTAASQSAAASDQTSSVAISREDPLACFKVKDDRKTAEELQHPFEVCGVPLINRDHRVSSSFTPKLATADVPTYGLAQVQLQPKAGAALTKMFAAARAAGLDLRVRYAYRSYAVQSAMYATGDRSLTAIPGASEHQSGLAVDLAAIEGGTLVRGTALSTSASGAWLVKHSAQYGFILRYPSGQSGITGISYEPWHFRYVGKVTALGVQRAPSRTLEEYLQQD